MIYISPDFITPFINNNFMVWFENVLQNFNLDACNTQLKEKLEPKEIDFCQEIIKHAKKIVQFDYNEMRNFLEIEIDNNDKLRIFFLENKINNIKGKWKRKHSDENRKNCFEEINKELESNNLTSLSSIEPIPEMIQKALETAQKAFSIDKISEVLFKLFDYDVFSDKFREDFIVASKVNVCPYCNSAFILNYHKDKNNKSTADLDHYYPRSRYPFFAVTLWNLIPICSTCNSRFKAQYDTFSNEILYPYIKWQGMDEINFIPKLAEKGYSFEDEAHFTIDVQTSNERSKNSSDLFHLQDLYENHKSIVARIAFLDRITTPKLCNEIASILNDKKINEQVVMNKFLAFQYAHSPGGILSKLTDDVKQFFENKRQKRLKGIY